MNATNDLGALIAAAAEEHAKMRRPIEAEFEPEHDDVDADLIEFEDIEVPTGPRSQVNVKAGPRCGVVTRDPERALLTAVIAQALDDMTAPLRVTMGRQEKGMTALDMTEDAVAVRAYVWFMGSPTAAAYLEFLDRDPAIVREEVRRRIEPSIEVRAARLRRAGAPRGRGRPKLPEYMKKSSQRARRAERVKWHRKQNGEGA